MIRMILRRTLFVLAAGAFFSFSASSPVSAQAPETCPPPCRPPVILPGSIVANDSVPPAPKKSPPSKLESGKPNSAKSGKSYRRR
jgi:hypothetical protein